MVGQLGGYFDAFDGIVGGDDGGVVGGFTPDQGSYEGGGVNVTGAVAAVWQLIMLIVAVNSVLIDHHAGFTGGVGNAGEDHVFAAQCQQLFQKLINISPVIFGFVFHIGQKAGLGDVGHDIISLAAQSFHGFHKGQVKAGVQAAVIGHSRVYDLFAAVSCHGGKDVGNVFNLFGAAQIAGINGVKGDALFFPMGVNGRNILRQIPEGIAGKTGGMGGKHRRRKHAGFNTAGGDDGQRNGQRALSDAGNILDC